MKELGSEIRRFSTHTVIAGAVITVTGFAPEEWVVVVAEGVGLPKGLVHLGPLGLDIRVVLVMVGCSAIIVGVIHNLRPRGYTDYDGLITCRGLGRIDTYYPMPFAHTPNFTIDVKRVKNSVGRIEAPHCHWRMIEQRADGFTIEIDALSPFPPPLLIWQAKGLPVEKGGAAS
jgi:hypothetical protein